MKRALRLTILFGFLLPLTGLLAQHNRQSDSLALVRLYESTGGDHWYRKDNWLQGTLESWYGVRLQSGTGRVEALALRHNNLEGELPDELVQLDSLKALILSDNELYGHIPALHTIPFYRDYSHDDWSESIFYLRNPQSNVLSGNRYSFADAEPGGYVYIHSFNYPYPVGPFVYTNVLKSKTFGVPSSHRVAEGADFHFSFPYRVGEDSLLFYWILDYGDTIAITDKPEYTLTSFDSALHSGAWHCVIRRKNELDLGGSKTNPVHYSAPIRLVGMVNEAPVVDMIPSRVLPHETPLSDRFIRAKDDGFGSIAVRLEDDLLVEDLSLRLVHTPVGLQVRASVSEDMGNSAIYKVEDMHAQSTFYLHLQRMIEGVVGLDSIVLEAIDKDGAATQSVFYLQTLESRLLYSVPVTEDISFRHRMTDEGMWLYWQNNPSLELLHLSFSYGTMSDTTCSIKRGAAFKLSVNADMDSVLLPQILIEPGRDVVYNLTAIPENWRGLGQPARYSVRLYDGPMKDSSLLRRLDFASSFRVEEYTDPLAIVLVAEDLSISGCSGAIAVHQLEKGELVSTRVLFSGNSAIYHLRTGIPYAFYAEVGNRFVSDTFHVYVPYSTETTPVVAGSLEWDVPCQKRIKKSTWIHNYYGDLDWDWETSSMFSFRDSLDYLIVEPLYPGSIGSEELRVQIRDKSGYVIDTTVSIRQIASNQVPVAIEDTVRLVIPYAWTPINLLAYIQDQETPDSLMVLNIVRQGGLRLKDKGFRTEILGGIDLVGQDTLIVEAWDEGCAMARMTFVVSYDTLGSNNMSPVWIDSVSLRADILGMTPEWINAATRSQYFLVEDTASFPTRIDLRKYIRDDGPFDELTLGVENASEMLERGLDIRIEDGFLTIRPREGVYYGYWFWDAVYRMGIVTRFDILLYAVDRFGAKSVYSGVEIRLTHGGRLAFDGGDLQRTYYLCEDDTLAIDLGTMLAQSNPGRIVPPVDIIGAYSAFNLPHIEVSIQDGKGLFTRRKDFTIPGTFSTTYDLKLRLAPAPFPDVLRRFNGGSPLLDISVPSFTITSSSDQCPEILPLVLGEVPVQNMNDGRESVVRPDEYIIGGQQGEAYFWIFSGGARLDYSYDDASGELRAVWRDPNHKGTDTLWVSARDHKDRQALSYIVYAHSEAPVMYPKPSDLSILKGESIPPLNLLAIIWDDETLPEDIVWQVESDISVLNPVISEAGILSLEIADTSWTGIVTVKLIATDESGLSDTAVFLVEIKDPVVTGLSAEACEVRLYPNPVGDILKVHFCTDIPEGKLRLFDMVGRMCLEKQITGWYMELGVQDLDPGMYMLQIEDATGKDRKAGKVFITQ